MAFNFIANTAAVLSLTSSAFEAGEAGMRNASQNAKAAVAINDIKNYTGDSLLNKSSEKHNEMKKIVRSGDLTTWFHKSSGAVSGFIKGAAQGLRGNLPSVGFSALTIAAKNKTLKTIGVVGVGITTAWDFLKNGTNLFTKRNTIEK